MKILFQGDSITDAGRDKRNYHDMGNGYPKFASALIAKKYPDTDFEFIIATPVLTFDEQLALNYRMILKLIREKTKAKIVMISPYVLDAPDKDYLRHDLVTVIPIVEELAREFADVYIPLNEKFTEALKTQPEPKYYSADGVHPNPNGAEFIGKLCAEAIDSLLK